jgi:putative NADH-flavin reductase
MRILVIGASGGTGRELVREALARGHAVTAFVRNPSRLRATDSRLRIAVGDVLDYASLEQGVRNQDAVLSALGHKRWLFPTRILSDGTRNLIRAMEAAGVRRLVCETALGVGDSWWRMGIYYTFFLIPFILPFYFYDKRRQEAIIRRSLLDWTIVRPGILTNGARRGVYRHGGDVGHWLWSARISRADVADFMLNQLESTACLRSAPGLAW